MENYFEILPPDATHAVLRIRHAPAETAGSDLERELTHDGHRLLRAVAPYYADLLLQMAPRFGHRTIRTSQARRACQSAENIFGEEIDERMQLTVLNHPGVKSKNAPAPHGSQYPNLHAHFTAEGLIEEQMIARIAQNPTLLGPSQDRVLTDHWRESRGALIDTSRRLITTVDHEPSISFWAARESSATRRPLTAEELGLRYCQAFLTFYNISYSPLRVLKVTPPATLVPLH